MRSDIFIRDNQYQGTNHNNNQSCKCHLPTCHLSYTWRSSHTYACSYATYSNPDVLLRNINVSFWDSRFPHHCNLLGYPSQFQYNHRSYMCRDNLPSSVFDVQSVRKDASYICNSSSYPNNLRVQNFSDRRL